MKRERHEHKKEEIERARKEHINAHKMAHCIGVAEYMRERADDFGIDGNVAYTAGLLHDIGYLEGRIGHEEAGAEILEACGMSGDIVFAVAYHAESLKKIPEDQVSPMLVLMVEADLSVEKNGFRVGFEKRLKDIAERYGTKDNPIFDSVKDNIAYIKNYWKINGIPEQDETVYRKHSCENNRGKWIGSSIENKNDDKEIE